MSAKSIESLISKANKMIAERDAEIRDIEETISETDEQIRANEHLLDEAAAKSDFDSYKRIKEDLATARGFKEMKMKRLESLTNAPLISSGEYEKMVAEVYAEYTRLEDEAKQKLVKLSDQMNEIANDMKSVVDDTNKALSLLQCDIYKLADAKRMPNGNLMPNQMKSVSSQVILWGKAGVDFFMYKNYTGRSAN